MAGPELGKADEHNLKCVSRERGSKGWEEFRIASCHASSTAHPLQGKSCHLNWNSEWISAARTCETHSNLKAQLGPAWGTVSLPPAARFHLGICTGTRDDTTTKQLTSWGRSVPDVFQHTSTSFTTERAAGTCSWERGPPSCTAACASGLNIAPVKLQFHSYSWVVLLDKVSKICKGGGRARSWSHLYNPSSLSLCFSSTGTHS